MKLLSTVYAYIVLNGTSKSGRYIEVAVKRGFTVYSQFHEIVIKYNSDRKPETDVLFLQRDQI